MNDVALPTGPLAGVTVLELGSTVAAPFCGRLLADFGASVIKVEVAEGDAVRSMGKRLDGRSLYAASIFRNKKLISIDLRRAEGQDLVRKLVRSCAIIIENFRPGTLERWQLGYEQLAAINPALVMVRISGFGQDGPYSQRPGFGVIAEAMGGLRHITGDPDRPPARVAVSLTDYLSGLYAAFGAVMAVMVARQTGRGQIVDAALSEAALSMLEPHIPAYEKLGVIANRAGSKLPDNVPNALFPTRDNSFIHIATVGEPVWRRLAAAIGRPELTEDARFKTAPDRAVHEGALERIITAWTTAHDLADIERILQMADVPATRIYTVADIFRDPHFAARQALVDAPDRDLGSVKMVNVVPRLSMTPGRIRHAGAGTVGADTRSVLRDIGGLSDQQIDALRDCGVILCTDRLGEVEPQHDG
jgi:crotonobetainyl-CoA:carnitine CoA-transferase CaiB-like acyl-CoA transferase